MTVHNARPEGMSSGDLVKSTLDNAFTDFVVASISAGCVDCQEDFTHMTLPNEPAKLREAIVGCVMSALQPYTAELDRLRADGATLKTERDEALSKLGMRDGMLAMTVARLGGTVEGHPTARVNFLQRIDELRDIESHYEAAVDDAEAWRALQQIDATPFTEAELAEAEQIRAKIKRTVEEYDIYKAVQRADEAHAAHSASFGALSTLSAALFDGEVDDYAALAEKIIARVRQLESDGATLRERVKELELGENRLLDAMVKERVRADSAEARFDTLAKNEATWMCGCGSLSGVNLTHCGRCNRPRAEFEIAKPASAPKKPESKRCSMCGCEWRGTAPTPNQCPSCGAVS